jgi:hypothetical protein
LSRGKALRQIPDTLESRDREMAAIDGMEAGRMRPFANFDSEFRKRLGF